MLPQGATLGNENTRAHRATLGNENMSAHRAL